MLKLVAPLLLFLFSGCTTKDTVIYPPCVVISTVDIPKPIKLRVAEEDAAVASAYINEFRVKLKAQNSKIEKANKLCKEWAH